MFFKISCTSPSEQWPNKKNTPWVCAFLKVASAAVNYETSPKLQALDQKTDDFSDWFSTQIGSASITNAEELEAALEQRNKLIIRPNQSPSFQLVNLEFRAKTKFSIFSKLIRKPGDSSQTLIEDGIGARLIVREEDLDKAEHWLKNELGMKAKTKKNASRGAQKDQDIYLVGQTDDGSNFEVQISTARNLKKGESGIYDARIYKQKQRFLIQARLFGSISKAQFEKKFKTYLPLPALMLMSSERTLRNFSLAILKIKKLSVTTRTSMLGECLITLSCRNQ